tara:strand:- start:606 stop:911 length:306 start_codon:yes stop_codon:yes gene_type:complete
MKMMFDQYSILHFATGIVAYFWGIGPILWVILHTIFEILENTKYSVYFINKYVSFWPGGKTKQDSIANMIGDTITAIIGWYLAYYIDFIGVKRGWYEGHLT